MKLYSPGCIDNKRHIKLYSPGCMEKLWNNRGCVPLDV
jgi:hypothetical protein